MGHADAKLYCSAHFLARVKLDICSIAASQFCCLRMTDLRGESVCAVDVIFKRLVQARIHIEVKDIVGLCKSCSIMATKLGILTLGDWVIFLSCPTGCNIPQVLQQALNHYALWYRGFNLSVCVCSAVINISILYPTFFFHINADYPFNIISQYLSWFEYIWAMLWLKWWKCQCSVCVYSMSIQPINKLYLFSFNQEEKKKDESILFTID